MNEYLARRTLNERKFANWIGSPEGGRRYWYEVADRSGWRARYVKEVDSAENTLRIWQEIYNADGQKVEIHEKYPVDEGHQPIPEK